MLANPLSGKQRPPLVTIQPVKHARFSQKKNYTADGLTFRRAAFSRKRLASARDASSAACSTAAATSAAACFAAAAEARSSANRSCDINSSTTRVVRDGSAAVVAASMAVASELRVSRLALELVSAAPVSM
jgi:hypothetical protein